MTPDLVSTSFSTKALEADDTFYLCHGQAGEWKLVGLSFVASGAVSGSSNKFTLAVSDGSTSVATTYDSETTAVVEGTAASLTLSEAGTAREFGPTDSVKVVYDETGTVSVDIQFVCAWQKVRV
mgnify:FL=1|tara:strand:+ start:66 stop:437 length:372 start_codon:yes stop_codon:yes gene_type:complete